MLQLYPYCYPVHLGLSIFTFCGLCFFIQKTCQIKKREISIPTCRPLRQQITPHFMLECVESASTSLCRIMCLWLLSLFKENVPIYTLRYLNGRKELLRPGYGDRISSKLHRQSIEPFRWEDELIVSTKWEVRKTAASEFPPLLLDIQKF